MTTKQNTNETNKDREVFLASEGFQEKLKRAINQTYLCGLAADELGISDLSGGLMLLGEILTGLESEIEPVISAGIAPEQS